MMKDPVCGMDIDPVRAVVSHEHDGKTYYFCSKACALKFERDPASFVK